MRHLAECPACGSEFETSIEAAQGGLGCPNCNAEFTPETLKQVDDKPKPIPPVERWEQKAPAPRVLKSMKIVELEAHASHLNVLCWILSIIGVVCAFFGVIGSTGGDKNDGVWFAAGAFITLAICAAFLSHLNYIRAALESRRD